MIRAIIRPIPWRDATTGLVNPIGERRLLTVIKTSTGGPCVATDVYWWADQQCFVDEVGDPMNKSDVLLWAYLSDALPEIRS